MKRDVTCIGLRCEASSVRWMLFYVVSWVREVFIDGKVAGVAFAKLFTAVPTSGEQASQRLVCFMSFVNISK